MIYQRFDAKYGVAYDISEKQFLKIIAEPYIKPVNRGESETYYDVRDVAPRFFYWKKGEEND